jgi:hypothetical protein
VIVGHVMHEVPEIMVSLPEQMVVCGFAALLGRRVS